jgi:sterol desaturase/sphingolipid hydroxylase (fatty acid hydroxylase superfamily)
MRENPVTFEMLLEQLEGLYIIQLAAIPMILLVLVEWYISFRQKKDYYDGLDTAAATFIGLVNVAISAAIKIVIFGFILLFYNLVPWSIPRTWWAFILCFVSIDFFRYWSHRIAHVNRFWWATHVTHHNSEKYNLSVSFRLGWTQHIKIIFFVPVALMGFEPIMFFICHQIAVLYQYWIHTEYIRKLPRVIEYFFTTPSHHRVHHGRNEHYLDKNYGSTLIIWDRMFNSFEPEGVQADYGITNPINSYNPVKLNFHEWVDIVKDVRKSRSFKEAWAMIFTSPSKLDKAREKFNKIYATEPINMNGNSNGIKTSKPKEYSEVSDV